MIFSRFRGEKLAAKKQESLNGGVAEFLNPREVFLTTTNFNTTDFEILVNEGDKVVIGQVVAKSKTGFEFEIHSTCSGVVKEIVDGIHSNGKKVRTVVVENDFKNTLHSDCVEEQNTDLLTKEEIIARIKRWGVIGRGGAGFPTYVKYQGATGINTVVLNGVECEPYITADYVLVKEEISKVVRGLQYMMKASGAMEGVIVIKKGKRELQRIIETEIFKLKDVRLAYMPDKYPAGWERAIIKTLFNKSYNKIPQEVGIIMNNVTTAYDVCVAVEDNQPLTTKYITLAGTAMRHPQNVKVRVGAKVSELLKDQLEQNGPEVILVAGGPMTGNAMKTEDFIVSRRNNAVLAFDPISEEVSKAVSNTCLRCGKCSDNCPSKLTPALIKEALDVKDKQLMKNLKSSCCIECGLCSYVCPSNIELTPSVKLAKLFANKA